MPSVSMIEGAALGGAIGGVPGAVWADRNEDGYVDGYNYNGQYYAGPPSGYEPPLHGGATGALAGAILPGLIAGRIAALPPPTGAVPPPPPPPPVPLASAGPPPEDEIQTDAATTLHYPVVHPQSATFTIADIQEVAARNHSPIDSVAVWQTTNGALTRSGLLAILAQCLAAVNEVGPECLALVRGGSGKFAGIPTSARGEFAAIHKESCPAAIDERICAQKLQSAAMFRALPRGGLHLSPSRMDEGKTTLFTALIRDSGQIEGRAGLPSDVGFEPDAAHAGQVTEITVVPYSPKMCFALTTPDPGRAKIVPLAGDRRTIEPPSRICMTQPDGMEAVKYDPSWWVTPLSGDDIKLYLTIEHYVGSERRNYPQEPWPISIDVMPKPTAWERINAFLKHAAETVGLGTTLAKAIGGLIAAVMAWGIWGLIKRRRPPQPAAR